MPGLKRLLEHTLKNKRVHHVDFPSERQKERRKRFMRQFFSIHTYIFINPRSHVTIQDDIFSVAMQGIKERTYSSLES